MSVAGNGNDVFDPYHKWLGIPPGEQPPNHYRLLGIALFEPDSDVIANAADQHRIGMSQGMLKATLAS